jgi:hypothetical protein
MTIAPGSYELGPGSGTLTVRTGRGGAAAKAGHDLELEVTRWGARLDVGDVAAATLTADARSLRVIRGSGGIAPLGDEEKAAIAKTIDDEVLRGSAIEFRSTRVDAAGDLLAVAGELALAGRRHTVAFDLAIAGGQVEGMAKIRQTDWGMKPYSTLFGTLKVADEVVLAISATLPSPQATATRSEHDG